MCAVTWRTEGVSRVLVEFNLLEADVEGRRARGEREGGEADVWGEGSGADRDFCSDWSAGQSAVGRKARERSESQRQSPGCMGSRRTSAAGRGRERPSSAAALASKWTSKGERDNGLVQGAEGRRGDRGMDVARRGGAAAMPVGVASPEESEEGPRAGGRVERSRCARTRAARARSQEGGRQETSPTAAVTARRRKVPARAAMDGETRQHAPCTRAECLPLRKRAKIFVGRGR